MGVVSSSSKVSLADCIATAKINDLKRFAHMRLSPLWDRLLWLPGGGEQPTATMSESASGNAKSVNLTNQTTNSTIVTPEKTASFVGARKAAGAEASKRATGTGVGHEV